MHTSRLDTRIGLIIPSSNRLTEPHMHRYTPEGVQAHVTRLRMTGPNHAPLAELMPRIVEATQALDDAGCNAIVFHCTASSMEAGLDGERQVLDAMRSVTHAVTATTASAALAALTALDLHRIALFSPYIAATHQHEIAFLAEAGYEVIGGKCLGLHGGDEYTTVKPAQWLRLATTNTPADADGVFLSCTNIHAPEIIAELEQAIRKPVVASNQAVLWYVLRELGHEGEVPELGHLFKARVAEPVRSA
ncbi:MAG: aspartate/glutamate racemase family protein [Chloroflexi bacterium]|nr:aspartate/glutamate racemase family protein [Chloroflexota bacterium]